MAGMNRHQRVVRWLDAQIEEMNHAIALEQDIDWKEYDMLIQTRTELQELKEDNALYQLNFGIVSNRGQ